MTRPNRDEYFLQIAKAVGEMSTRAIKCGVVAVKDKHIVSTAFGTEDICAIMNLICMCVRMGISLKGTTIYTNAGSVHDDCQKYLDKIGIKEVVKRGK